ncbi:MULTISPECIES: hypothetical protein [Brevibacillus]|uniref:hypothetical protein n=1 Tax=Brevibacillus TaxID=55080 RepID=UPI00203C0449|nr:MULTISPECIES: hypothetical protein [Brevibacillus]MCM3625267.1 hypothetical protein [Brevibacillus borstelensis]MDH4619952.1 hypothetical protein [Brevibacillus sp. AY1]
MSRLMEFLKEVKELFGDRDKPVMIRNFLYERLLEQAAGDEKQVERIVNGFLADKFEQMEEESREREEREKHDKELVDYYVFLDKHLNATINRNIEIGITNELVGYEPHYCNYTLKDYKLSKPYKYLTLELERNGERYPITFDHIDDIKFLEAGDTLKTWIYMQRPLPTWRFYLDYDPDLAKQDVNSGRLTL